MLINNVINQLILQAALSATHQHPAMPTKPTNHTQHLLTPANDSPHMPTPSDASWSYENACNPWWPLPTAVIPSTLSTEMQIMHSFLKRLLNVKALMAIQGLFFFFFMMSVSPSWRKLQQFVRVALKEEEKGAETCCWEQLEERLTVSSVFDGLGTNSSNGVHRHLQMTPHTCWLHLMPTEPLRMMPTLADLFQPLASPVNTPFWVSKYVYWVNWEPEWVLLIMCMR